jgi:hypothetical protein
MRLWMSLYVARKCSGSSVPWASILTVFLEASRVREGRRAARVFCRVMGGTTRRSSTAVRAGA